MPDEHDRPDDAHLDGCDLDFTVDPTPDDQVDLVVLFADVAGDPLAVEARRREWIELAHSGAFDRPSSP